jgi:surface polysaccharide O-acyltransferase-like enzyme
VLQGKTWDHLWYLYSIIGIYLVIPLLKPFVNNAGKKGVEYILAVLFMFTSVIPTAENFFNFKSGFYIPINSIFVFYFLLGHYVHHYKTLVGNKILAGLAVFFLVFNVLVPLPGLIEGNSPLVVMITFVLFCFARQNYRQNKWIDLISPLCFGMYLIHMLFINFFWRILKFTPEKYPPLLVAPVTVIAVIGLSALFSHSAHRIKFVRQHLL